MGLSVVVGEGQIIVAAEISTESLDTAKLQPMIETACRELAATGVTERPGVVLADAGYWRNDAIENLIAQGVQKRRGCCESAGDPNRLASPCTALGW